MNKKLGALLMAMIVVVTLVGFVVSGRIVAAQSGRLQPLATDICLQKWEYRVLTATISTVQSEMYQLGEQGFEIAGFEVTTYQQGIPYYHILFKRPKP
jgi:hypothetical protein